MITTFAAIVQRTLEEDHKSILDALAHGVSDFDTYNRLVGELKGINRALRTLDETLKAYDEDESIQ